MSAQITIEKIGLIGRIIQAETKEPIPAVLITTAENHASVSGMDGEFFLPVDVENGAKLTLTDRFGAILAIRDIQRGDGEKVEVALEAALVERHLASPMEWTTASGSILNSKTENIIGWATEKAGELAKPFKDFLPPLCSFPDLLTDASGAIKGDLVALDRLDEVMVALDRLTPSLESLESFDTTQSWQEAGRFLEYLDKQETKLQLDGVANLLMAVCLLARRKKQRAARYVGIAEYHILRADEAARLGAVAERALYGDAAALTHWRAVWDLYSRNGQVGTFEPDWRSNDFVSTTINVGPDSVHAIVNLHPRRACPGETVTLTGDSFGTEPGQVRFVRRGGGLPLDVPALEWTSRRVRAQVPTGAGAGPVSSIRHIPVVMHGRVIPMSYEVATSFFDLEPTAEVLVLSVNGNARNPVVVPGTSADILWQCAGTDSTRLRVISGGAELVNRVVSASGSHSLAVPDLAEPSELMIEISGTGTCPPLTVRRTLTAFIERPYNLTIDGVEITQAIQYFRSDRHMTDPADRRPDNSIPIIPFKPVMLRVYVRSGLDPAGGMGTLRNVTGRVQITRFLPGRTTRLESELRPVNPAPVTALAGPPYMTERGNLANTLNFIIPGSEVFGSLCAQIEISSDAAHSGSGRATHTVRFDCSQWRTLQLAGVFVRYNGAGPSGGSITIPAPTMPDLQRSTGWLRETYPVSEVIYRDAGGFTLTVPLNDPALAPGACSANWNTLLTQVINTANADGNRPGWAYFGLLPPGIPVGAVVGCGGTGIGTGGVGPNNVTLAHEVGHAFGVAHAPCGGVGAPTAGYPQYEPYDVPIAGPTFASASIGEYGVQISTQTLFNPTTTKDFMSYCGPQWISLFMTDRLLTGSLLAARDLPPGVSGDVRRDQPMENLIVIVGVLQRPEGEDGPTTIDVRSVARLDTRKPERGSGIQGFVAELIDSSGAVLAAASLDAIRADFCCADGAAQVSSGFTPFQATLVNAAPGAALRIRHDKNVLWTSQAPAKPSAIKLSKLAVKDVTMVDAAWEVSGSVDPDVASVWVQWRRANDNEWSSLAVDLKHNNALLDVSGLPREGPVVFRFLLNDGFTTAIADSDAVHLPPRPPAASIVQPQLDRVRAGQSLNLLADGVSYTGKELASDAFRWELNGQEIANSREAWIAAPSPGKHELKLTVTDAAGTGEAHLVFVVEELK